MRADRLALAPASSPGWKIAPPAFSTSAATPIAKRMGLCSPISGLHVSRTGPTSNGAVYLRRRRGREPQGGRRFEARHDHRLARNATRQERSPPWPRTWLAMVYDRLRRCTQKPFAASVRHERRPRDIARSSLQRLIITAMNSLTGLWCREAASSAPCREMASPPSHAPCLSNEVMTSFASSLNRRSGRDLRVDLQVYLTPGAVGMASA